MRTHARPRRELHPIAFALLRPFLAFSISRDAWVLALVGNHVGPVVRRRRTGVAVPNGSQHPPRT